MAVVMAFQCDRCGQGIEGEPLLEVGSGRILCGPCMHHEDTKLTVKKVDIFGNVIDTHMTEGELNGFRMEQGRLNF